MVDEDRDVSPAVLDGHIARGRYGPIAVNRFCGHIAEKASATLLPFSHEGSRRDRGLVGARRNRRGEAHAVGVGAVEALRQRTLATWRLPQRRQHSFLPLGIVEEELLSV